MSKHRITRETQTQTYIHNLVSGDRKIAQYRKWGGGGGNNKHLLSVLGCICEE